MMSRNSLFFPSGRQIGSTRSSSSYSNDDDCYVDECLVEKLGRKRNMVMPLMDEAEEKQFTDKRVKKWLVDLKHTIHDVNSLLDLTEAEAKFKELDEMYGSCSSSRTHCISKQQATSKIKEMTEKLVDLAEEGRIMGLTGHVGGSPASASALPTQVPTHRNTTSVLNESAVIYGREKEKKQILELVLSSLDPVACENKVDVIGIVGMGGLGKTTLAQFVYNHAKVKEDFTRSWACVSDNFDLVRVSISLLESLTDRPCSFSSLNKLQEEIKKTLTGKKFLTVLDDVWDLSKQNWEKLMAPFGTGANGSKIIVTTRDQRVATVSSAYYTVALEPMSEDEGWSLFSNDVFRDGDLCQHPELEVIGKEIVRKCGGLPLAIKTLSGVLRSERRGVEWERIRGSSLWQLPLDQNDIIPALGLSYTYLPSHLKTCFAYCSLFPKDFVFSKKNLVDLWVDEGFVQQSDSRSEEEVGRAYFEDLKSRSFFTQVYKYEDEYVMHDLMHHLAQVLYADSHLYMDGHSVAKDRLKIHHVSFEVSRVCNSFINVESLAQIKSLQTFMAYTSSSHHASIKPLKWDLDDKVLEKILLRQLSLRVLCLKGSRIRALPDTISNLKVLRCLDVSHTDVEELPTSLCEMYNLRCLLCDHCDGLRHFHIDISRLVSLRRLTLSGKLLQRPPQNLSQLVSECDVRMWFQIPVSSEQLLLLDGSDVAGDHTGDAGSVDGSERMQEATDDAALPCQAVEPDSRDTPEGQVYAAMNQTDKSDSGKRVMHVQVSIHQTSFVYKASRGYFCFRFMDHYDLLLSVMPHRDVKEVTVKFFNGMRFPDWLADQSYRNIEKVYLNKCRISSGRVPAFGHLPSLKHLSLRLLGNVKTLGREFYNCSDPFRFLKELCLKSMKDWEEWEPFDDAAEEICFFPHLEKLELDDCPRLKGRLPANLPSLKELLISECPSLQELDGFHRQLVSLRISRCGPRLVNFCLVDNMLNHSFPSLRRVQLEDCDSVESFPIQGAFPASLTYLSIENFTELKRLNVIGLRSLICLEELEIHDCPLLEALPEESWPHTEDVSLAKNDELSSNSSLTKLIISFENLKRINGTWLRSFTSLKELRFVGCRELEALPEECLPRSLTTLQLWSLDSLKRLDRLGLHNLTTLEKLDISYCRNLEALPEKGLPLSLKKLTLKFLENLDTLEGIDFESLTSLEKLDIYKCTLEDLSFDWRHPTLVIS